MESIVGKYSRHYWMGIAMIWIVLFHWMTPICNNEQISATIRLSLSRIFGSGFVGVDIFLFLSAYGLCYSFENNNYRIFLQRRLKRLFPMYLVFIICYLYYIIGIREIKSFIEIACLQISGLSSFSGVSYAWYIPATIFIYWSFPLWYYLVKYLMRTHSILPFVFIMGILIIKPLTAPYIYWLLNGRFIMVVLGIITYLWHKNHDNNKNNLILYYTIPVIIGMFFGQAKSEIIGLSLPLIFYAIDNSGIPHYGNKAISFIGKHTLEIYLAQCIAIEALTPSCISMWFKNINFSKELYWPTCMLLEILLTIVISWILYIIQTKFWDLQSLIKCRQVSD